ncbi:MAG TPA: DUF4190 domain-containing protein [Candidatus Limnocylindrales bacterium]
MSYPPPEPEKPATPNPYAAPRPPAPPPPASPPPPPYTPNYLPPPPMPGGQAPIPGRTNGLAIASLATGVGSLLLICCSFLSGPAGAVAIVLGVIALNQIGQRGQDGRGMAIAGIATGAAAIVFQFFRLALFGFNAFPDTGVCGG